MTSSKECSQKLMLLQRPLFFANTFIVKPVQPRQN